MLEILIVTLLVGMLLAILIPRISLTPKKMVVEKAISEIKQAFSETAARSRAGGKAYQLILNPEENKFTVNTLQKNLSREWQAERPASGEKEVQQSGILQAKDNYQISTDIEWEFDNNTYDNEGMISYSFFPDGQAGGPTLIFEIKKQKFTLWIDGVTSRVNIDEMEF